MHCHSRKGDNRTFLREWVIEKLIEQTGFKVFGCLSSHTLIYKLSLHHFQRPLSENQGVNYSVTQKLRDRKEILWLLVVCACRCLRCKKSESERITYSWSPLALT